MKESAKQQESKNSSLSISLDLSKLGQVKDGKVIIPLDSNCIVMGKGGENAYLGLTAYEAKNQKGNQTHIIKPNISKDAYSQMSEEQRKNVPIVGGLVDWQKTK